MNLRVAMVGCGAVAEYLHAPAIDASACCTLVSVIDPDQVRAQNLASKYGQVEVLPSLAHVAGNADFVVLATPPHLHVSLALEAFDLGLDVLIEKPLANTVDECEQIARAAVDRGRRAGVFHQFRFWPNRRDVAARLQTGEWPLPRRVWVEQGRPYSWNTATGYTFRRDRVCGGVLVNAGTHPMDSLISWLGVPLEYDYCDDACGGLESNARITMQFAGGVTGEFRISRTCTLANEIRLEWDGFSVVMNNSDAFHYALRRSDGAKEEMTCGNPARGFHGPAVDLYADFCSAINEKRDPMVSVPEGTRVLRWVEGCYRQKRQRALPTLAPQPGLTW